LNKSLREIPLPASNKASSFILGSFIGTYVLFKVAENIFTYIFAEVKGIKKIFSTKTFLTMTRVLIALQTLKSVYATEAVIGFLLIFLAFVADMFVRQRKILEEILYRLRKEK